MSAKGNARYPGRAAIEAYGNGGFRFAGMSHKGSILCLASAIVAWRPTSVAELTPADLAEVLAERHLIDVVLLGTGREHAWPAAEIGAAVREAGLALDVMATGPAARTFNVMLGEGRRVVAGLMAVW